MPKGQYERTRAPLLDRLQRHVRVDFAYTHYNGQPCWIWTGAQYKNGYGHAYFGTVDGKRVSMSAARAMWTAMRGPLPPDLEPDHLCRVRLCVNPDHLDPVTHSENRRRSRGYPHTNPRRASLEAQLRQIPALLDRLQNEGLTDQDAKAAIFDIVYGGIVGFRFLRPVASNYFQPKEENCMPRSVAGLFHSVVLAIANMKPLARRRITAKLARGFGLGVEGAP